MSIISRQLAERSRPFRPFAAHGETLNTDVDGNPTLTSYTYPADYGEKMDSAGFIGDRSKAGKRAVQYGTHLDDRPLLYLLTDSDVQTLLRWMPGGWNLPKLRGILLDEFHRTAIDLPALTWQDITALLNARSPAPADDTLWAKARWIAANCQVTSDDLRKRQERHGDIQKRTPKGSKHPEYYLPDVERAFPNKAPALVKKFRAQF